MTLLSNVFTAGSDTLLKVRYVQRCRRSDRNAQRVAFHSTIHQGITIRLAAVKWSDSWKIRRYIILQNVAFYTAFMTLAWLIPLLTKLILMLHLSECIFFA